MKIIDVHAHIFPEKIAFKASENIGNFYGIKMKHNGTTESLISRADKAGIDRLIVHSVATTEKQIDSINSFIAEEVSLFPDRLLGFATLHPCSTEIPRQIDDAINLGLKGIKLHPDFQRFNIDDKIAFKIYEAIEGRLPLIVHTGDSRTEFSKPQRLVKVLEQFPKLDVIAAHFGGYSEWENAALSLADKHVFVDCSSTRDFLKPHQVRELFDIFTADKIMFGTDYPMWDPADETEYFTSIQLSDEEREKFMHGNIEKLMAKYGVII